MVVSGPGQRVGHRILCSGTSPSGFYYHSATLADGNVYVFGGGKGHKLKSADLGKYTIHSNTWQLLSSGEVIVPQLVLARP